MTQAYNLSQLANNLNTSGQLDATDGLVNAVPIANGGTGASTQSGARTNLDVPSTGGSGASGTWGINISGNAATATSATSASSASSATYATTAGNGGVTSVNSSTGAVTVAEATTANVLSANAGASVGVVGTYAMLRQDTGTDYPPGNTLVASGSGSSLQYVDNGSQRLNYYAPNGSTWRAMGYNRSGYGGIWLRIS
jgi:hypothetical protein